MYNLGYNRLLYQPSDRQAGHVVSVEFFNPSGEFKGSFGMEDAGLGLYSLDVNFKSLGPYLMRITDDMTIVLSEIIRVGVGRILVPYQEQLPGI